MRNVLLVLQLISQLKDFDFNLPLPVMLEDAFVGLSLSVLDSIEVFWVGLGALVFGSKVGFVALDVARCTTTSRRGEPDVGSHSVGSKCGRWRSVAVGRIEGCASRRKRAPHCGARRHFELHMKAFGSSHLHPVLFCFRTFIAERCSSTDRQNAGYPRRRGGGGRRALRWSKRTTVSSDNEATYLELLVSRVVAEVRKTHYFCHLNASLTMIARYRKITPKARLVPLTQPFLDYLRADSIVLPDDEVRAQPDWSDDSGVFSASDDQDQSEDEDGDIAADWRDVHSAIQTTIANLDGKVIPKLNWSAPKDATYMNANSMDCRTPQDVYLLLKSSDFITHDLEHAFDDTVDDPELQAETIPYYLVLRKAVGKWNPSMEFRCFVRRRKLLCMCQRDLNHFDFLFNMSGQLRSRIQEFFDVRLRDTFEDENFVFDVYVPPPHDRVWLVDVNPWAPRTDPLLFSWLEILEMPDPPELVEGVDFVRLSLKPGSGPPLTQVLDEPDMAEDDDVEDTSSNSDESDEEADEEIWLPELRLIKKTDPEAYSFSTPQYSAHKLPRDVVDASQSGEGLREFARDWQNVLAQRQKQDAEAESSGDD